MMFFFKELTWPMAKRLKLFGITLRQTNIAMEKWTRIEDLLPIENGDLPLLRLFTRGYIFSRENKPFKRLYFRDRDT